MSEAEPVIRESLTYRVASIVGLTAPSIFAVFEKLVHS